ncbi:MAG: rod shape-determining protein MreD [Tuberibacillus sp.]
MRAVKLFLVLFAFFILQGTVMQVFSPSWFGFDFISVPHFVLIAVIMIGLFFDRAHAVWYGILFGLFIDLVYTNILGVYAFCIPLVAYLLSYLARVFHLYLIIVFFIGIIGVAMLELGVYGIYGLIGKATMDIYDYAKWRMLPTIVVNGVFLLIIFYPLRRLLLGMKLNQTEDR